MHDAQVKILEESHDQQDSVGFHGGVRDERYQVDLARDQKSQGKVEEARTGPATDACPTSGRTGGGKAFV
ncbi:hypothetical protein EXS71_04145 [Candidatus Uhrbacteria bacterium]|nr:hypothetical protein [Candidatus Uhrbacteria bacterium]